MTYHAGPAGSRFRDIEDAGRHMLKINCNNYPLTTNSYILPPLFLSQYPEGNNPTTSKLEPRVAPPLSGNEQKKFDGMSSGQGGEQVEYKAFNLFTKLLEEEQDIPVLVLRGFELNTVGKGNLKLQTLKSEYPQITNIDMRGQQDCMIFLKDLGFICIEIKRSSSAESVQKAKDQLDRSESFLNNIMPLIAPNSCCLPILKLVMFELDDPHHSLATNSADYHFFNCSGDSIAAFKFKWKDLKQELQSRLPANPPTSLEFKRLARLLTGLWSMKSMNRQTYFDVNDASLPHLTTQVDVSVDHAHLCSDAKKAKITNNPQYAPVTNVIYNQQGTVFRKANEINLMYLTPEQKNIYDNVRCGIIRGAAGTGKTLLILFKIIDIVQSYDNRKIILIAPHPHTLRCKNILQANGVRVMKSEHIPPETETVHDVVIIGMRNMHSVLNSSLSVLSNHHLFIDDLQSLFGRDISYRDVQLMKRVYEIATQNNLYFWCMDDSLQQTYYSNQSKTKPFYSNLFPSVRDDAIVPTYSLQNILRNTKEISNVVLDERGNAKSSFNLPSVDAHSSHNITSTLPTIHYLIGYHGTFVDADFFVERLEEELRPFVGTTKTTPLSNIAVLYADHPTFDKEKFLKTTREMLSTRFNIIPMTIEQQLKSVSPTIVFDHVKNATSGEWPVVIYIKHEAYTYNSPYIASSRARTRLIVIGSIYESTSNILSHGANVLWRLEDSKFVRVGDTLSYKGMT